MRHLAMVILPLVVACGREPVRERAPAVDVAESAAVQGTSAIMPLEDVPRSQAGSVMQRVANTDITVTYSRPVARGRELFGALVPYGQVWNPGANDASAISISRDVTVDGHALDAGKYSIWTIPRADAWTLIFSHAADVFHTPYPGEAEDALRLEVAPETGPHMEMLTFSFPVVDGKDAVLRLHWGTTMVDVAVRVP